MKLGLIFKLRNDFLFSTVIIMQIANHMLKRQMITVTLRMLYPRKPRGVLQPIKIFLSETSRHRFQTCLQSKTLDSKVNTMYDLLFQRHYLTYLHCVCLYLNFNYTLKINILLTGYSSGWATSMHGSEETWKQS